jgi:hypothetical protein
MNLNAIQVLRILVEKIILILLFFFFFWISHSRCMHAQVLTPILFLLY